MVTKADGQLDVYLLPLLLVLHFVSRLGLFSGPPDDGLSEVEGRADDGAGDQSGSTAERTVAGKGAHPAAGILCFDVRLVPAMLDTWLSFPIHTAGHQQPVPCLDMKAPRPMFIFFFGFGRNLLRPVVSGSFAYLPPNKGPGGRGKGGVAEEW